MRGKGGEPRWEIGKVRGEKRESERGKRERRKKNDL